MITGLFRDTGVIIAISVLLAAPAGAGNDVPFRIANFIAGVSDVEVQISDAADTTAKAVPTEQLGYGALSQYHALPAGAYVVTAKSDGVTLFSQRYALDPDRNGTLVLYGDLNEDDVRPTLWSRVTSLLPVSQAQAAVAGANPSVQGQLLDALENPGNRDARVRVINVAYGYTDLSTSYSALSASRTTIEGTAQIGASPQPVSLRPGRVVFFVGMGSNLSNPLVSERAVLAAGQTYDLFVSGSRAANIPLSLTLADCCADPAAPGLSNGE